MVVVVVYSVHQHSFPKFQYAKRLRGRQTVAAVPSKQEQPLDRAVELSVQLVAKEGSVVVAALFSSSGAGVGTGSLLFRTGNVALRAGIVVTVVTVVVLYD